MPYYLHVIGALVILFFAHAQWQCWMIYTNRLHHPQIVGTPQMAARSLPIWILEIALAATLLLTRGIVFLPIWFILYGIYRAWWAYAHHLARWPLTDYGPGGPMESVRKQQVAVDIVAALCWGAGGMWLLWKYALVS